MAEVRYFFSYSRHDAPFVLKLAQELRNLGADLWLDQLDILAGHHWDRAVEEALLECKGMIAVLSPESLASNSVMDEISYALEANKFVVPILLRDCNVPFRLRRVQRIDFSGDYSVAFSQLIRALGIESKADLSSVDSVTHPLSSPSVVASNTLLPPTIHLSPSSYVETERTDKHNGTPSRAPQIHDSAGPLVPLRNGSIDGSLAVERFDGRHPRIAGALRVALIGLALNLLLLPLDLYLQGVRYVGTIPIFMTLFTIIDSALLWSIAGLIAGRQKRVLAWTLIPAIIIIAVSVMLDGPRGLGTGIFLDGFGAIAGTTAKQYWVYRMHE